jgi:ribA/ribD-fused uncharacterized protein
MFDPDAKLSEQVRRRYNSGDPSLEFVFFWGHSPSHGGLTTSCFSQWYETPFTEDGVMYRTAEHYMMAEKAKLFGDADAYLQILAAPGPKAAKALGRKVRGFSEEVWREHRFEIVTRANRAKFGQHEDLRKFLVQTGSRVLVEASPYDQVWGIGLAREDARAKNPNQWRGLNLLGFALMKVRDEF